MMRCLKCVSLIALVALAACNMNPYRHIAVSQPTPGHSALRFKPKVTRELYRCVVDGKFLFKRFHLSGVLFFKRFDDGTTRAVFQNEMGLAFFDFAWNTRDSFSVKSVMQQLDKPAVIKTLRTDLGLLLMTGLDRKAEVMLIAGTDTLSRFPVNKGYAYYRHSGNEITSIEYAGKTRITSVKLESGGRTAGLPASITFAHHKAHFSIVLKKLSQDEQ